MSKFEKLQEVETSISKKAYAPYSNIYVGSALLGENGEIFSVCNIENALYSLTCSAERVAIFNAVSNGTTNFKMFVITSNTEKPISPCGACRQVMSEFFDNNVKIILTNQQGSKKEVNIKDLLPYSFNL